MNFLGHALFSGDEDDAFLTGNVLGDFIKGNPMNHGLPEGILRGIAFHRQLDTIGDQSSGFLALRELLGHDFGHYRGVIADIIIDHLIAFHWDEFRAGSLESFASATYPRMKPYLRWFPERTSRMYGFMTSENWFVMYRDLKQIRYILQRIETRSAGGFSLSAAAEQLRLHHAAFSTAFFQFIEEMSPNIPKIAENRNIGSAF